MKVLLTALNDNVQVLTNGSFVSLKDIPSGCSEEGSARLTASTGTDDSGSSDTSSGSGLASAGDYNNIGQCSYYHFSHCKIV